MISNTSPTDSFLPPKLPNVDTVTLSNGLKCILIQDHSNPVLCLQIYIRTGSVKEQDGQHGYSHFLEHLCFKATEDFPRNGISSYASGLGAMLNAYTDYDCTCYYVLIPAEQMDAGLYILSQLVMHPSFLRSDIESEKDIIIEEIRQYENEPEQDFIEYIQVHHFEKSPLKRPVLGDVSSVRKANLKKLTNFYKSHYHPYNSFIVLCGDFSKQQAEVALNKYYAHWDATQNEYPAISSDTEPELPEAKRLFRKRTAGEELIAITLPELCEAHPLADPMLIAMRYFAIGKSSRLFKRLVEQEKLCSSVKVSSLSGLLSGISVIHICPIGNKHNHHILEIVRNEYNLLIKYGIPNEELSLIKKDIIHSWIYGFEGVENTANQIAAEEFIGNLDKYTAYCQNISAITHNDVKKALELYWTPGNISIYHQGSKELADFTSFSFNSTDVQSSLLHDDSWHHDVSITNSESVNVQNKSAIDIKQISDHHYQLTLSGGMKLLYQQQAQTNISGFSIASHISQLCESEHERGLNFFCTTLMLYGTEHHTHEQLMRLSRQHGFNIRVIHHLDSTTFRGKCRTAELETALATLSEIIMKPKFDAGHLSLLKAAALDGIKRDNDYPVSYAYQKWFQMLVGRRSNLSRSTGNTSDIRAITLNKVTSWYHRWCINRDFCLGIVSSLDPHVVGEMCEKYFCSVNTSETSLDINASWQSVRTHSKKQHRLTDQAIIHLGGFASPASKREENAAFHVLAHILGGDISSRFFDVIREQNALAYQTGFDFSSIQDLGFWNAYAFCDPKYYKQCLKLMQEIIYDVCINGVTAKELRDAIQYLISMNRFDNESVSYTASSMASLAALGYEADYYLKRESRLMSVSLDTINQIASQAFSEDNQFLHILV